MVNFDIRSDLGKPICPVIQIKCMYVLTYDDSLCFMYCSFKVRKKEYIPRYKVALFCVALYTWKQLLRDEKTCFKQGA